LVIMGKTEKGTRNKGKPVKKLQQIVQVMVVA